MNNSLMLLVQIYSTSFTFLLSNLKNLTVWMDVSRIWEIISCGNTHYSTNAILFMNCDMVE